MLLRLCHSTYSHERFRQRPLLDRQLFPNVPRPLKNHDGACSTCSCLVLLEVACGIVVWGRESFSDPAASKYRLPSKEKRRPIQIALTFRVGVRCCRGILVVFIVPEL